MLTIEVIDIRKHVSWRDYFEPQLTRFGLPPFESRCCKFLEVEKL